MMLFRRGNSKKSTHRTPLILRLQAPDQAWCVHHITRHNTPIHNILSTAPQLSVSQKVLGTLSEDGNAMPKQVGATIHN
jgi:hypothetical protein